MTDLSTVLPDFPSQPFIHLIPSLERNHVTTADLLTLDAVEIAKRAHLPLLDVKKLCSAILYALQSDLGISKPKDGLPNTSKFRKTGKELVNSWNTVSTLDDELDRALGGGIPIGYITEITGESGAGKTQFLLTLLLSVQLPAPQGLSSSALYISTESALPTTRITQLLHSLPSSIHPLPSLDNIISIVTPDLESQDHILRFQVPVAIKRHGIRLLIIDSVAANYRAEFERPGGGGRGAAGGEKAKVPVGQNMAMRSAELVKLGQFLRDLAREFDLAVVVSNQVADRFAGKGGNSPILQRGMQNGTMMQRPGSSLVQTTTTTTTAATIFFTHTPDPLSLDHQQRFFTGWGDSPGKGESTNMKTPSLGLIWSTQIACRIALIKKPVYGYGEEGDRDGGNGGRDGNGVGIRDDDDNGRGELVLRLWRRWMKVVFAKNVGGSGRGVDGGGAVEFEIRGEGVRSLKREERIGEENRSEQR